MKLLILLWLVIGARCQEEETSNIREGHPNFYCNFNQDGSQTTRPSIHSTNGLAQGKPGKAGPPGARGQKGEAGGLNYTLAESLKRELDEVNRELADVKTNLSSTEAKLGETNEELAEIKTKLTSSEAKFAEVNRELADVKTNLSSSESKLGETNEELAEVKTNLSLSKAKIDEMNKELSDLKQKQENRLHHLSSCSDINGTTEDNGDYLINPDLRHLTPFYVFCNFSGNVPETVVRHNSMDEFEFSGCDPAFCYKKKIVYGATLRQITALIDKSRNCRQFIKLRCINVVIQFSGGDSYAGWLSRDGTRQSYWGGATSRRPHYCACGESGSCSNSQKKCNCDRNDNAERSDEGYLTYKDHLPVTELQFGDASPPSERGWHTLGPLICSD